MKTLPDATFEIFGKPHKLVGRSRRYGQPGLLIQRTTGPCGERCGHAYWVAVSSLPQEVRDAVENGD